MELELKHLAPYLPYGLKLKLMHPKEEHQKIGPMSRIAHNDSETHPERVAIDYDDYEHIWIFKPILRPLFDLTKEIDYNGKTYEYLECLRTFCICDAEHDFIDACQDCPPSIDEKFKVCPYNLIQKLLEWHFDVFGLIEKGLAIDMNTLKVKS